MFDKKQEISQVLEENKPKNDGINKTNISQKIVYDSPSKSWKVMRTLRHYAFSVSLRKWVKKNENTELLPLSVLEPEPKKTVVLPIIVTKSVVLEDATLGTGFFLREYEYKVTEEYPSEFLVLKHGTVFRNNFALKECSPLPVIEGSKVQGILFSQVGNDKRISEAEALMLMQEQKLKIYNQTKDGLQFEVPT